MRFDKTDGGREKGVLRCEALCCDDKNYIKVLLSPALSV